MNDTTEGFGGWTVAAVAIPVLGATVSMEVEGVALFIGLGRDNYGHPVALIQHLPKGPGVTQLSVARRSIGGEIPLEEDLFHDHINEDGVAEIPSAWGMLGVINETSPSHLVFVQEIHKGTPK